MSEIISEVLDIKDDYLYFPMIYKLFRLGMAWELKAITEELSVIDIDFKKWMSI